MTSSTCSLPDLQNTPDVRGVSIDRVGITNYKFPIKVLTKHGYEHPVSSLTDLYVGLPSSYKGVNMSRFSECLTIFSDKTLSSSNFLELLKLLNSKMKSKDAYARFEFDYFIYKKAPVSKKEAPQAYRCAFSGILKEESYVFIVEVNVIAASVCPCSKGMSSLEFLNVKSDLKVDIDPELEHNLKTSDIGKQIGMGAHNQRSQIRVRVEIDPSSEEKLWIEDIIALVEENASAPTFPILKRPDEKYVTELGYKNAKFSEDILRDIYSAINKLKIAKSFSVKVENEESIHPYNATCIKHSENWNF